MLFIVKMLTECLGFISLNITILINANRSIQTRCIKMLPILIKECLLNNSKSNTKNIKPSNPQQRDSIIWFITEHYLCCYTQTSWPYKGECLHCTCSLTLTGCYLEDTILLFFGIYYKWLQVITDFNCYHQNL